MLLQSYVSEILNGNAIYCDVGGWCETSDISNSVKKADYRFVFSCLGIRRYTLGTFIELFFLK